MPVARVPCGLFVVFCLVESSLSAGFCLALQVYSPSFHSPRPRSLSLSRPFLLQPLAPGANHGWLRCLSWLPFVACCPSPSFLWHTCWYPSVSVRLSYGLLFSTFLVGSSSSAFPWRPSNPFFWGVRGVGWSSWLSPLPSARL